MKIKFSRNLSLLMIQYLIFIMPSTFSQSQNNDSTISAKQFKYMQINTDSNGNSHFSAEEMAFHSIKFSPQLPSVSVTDSNLTSDMIVISAPAEGKKDWHCVP